MVEKYYYVSLSLARSLTRHINIVSMVLSPPFSHTRMVLVLLPVFESPAVFIFICPLDAIVMLALRTGHKCQLCSCLSALIF